MIRATTRENVEGHAGRLSHERVEMERRGPSLTVGLHVKDMRSSGCHDPRAVCRPRVVRCVRRDTTRREDASGGGTRIWTCALD